jgi:hypothetical protein
MTILDLKCPIFALSDIFENIEDYFYSNKSDIIYLSIIWQYWCKILDKKKTFFRMTILDLKCPMFAFSIKDFYIILLFLINVYTKHYGQLMNCFIVSNTTPK